MATQGSSQTKTSSYEPEPEEEEYVEPTEEEMKALFRNVKIPKGFDTFGQDVIVLPISLIDYRKLWYD